VAKVLNDKQIAFIDDYFVTGNISASYKKVFGTFNYNKAISILDSELGYNRLKKLRDKHKRIINVSASDVLAKLQAMSTTTVFDILDPETLEIKPNIDRYSALMVKSIKVTKRDTKDGVDTTIQVSLNDRTRVLELLGKNIALFKDNVSVDVQVSIKDQIKSAEVGDDEVMAFLKMTEQKRKVRSLPAPTIKEISIDGKVYDDIILAEDDDENDE